MCTIVQYCIVYTVQCTMYIHENSQTIFVALSLKVVLKCSTLVAQVSGKKSSVMYCTVGKPTKFVKFPVEGGVVGGWGERTG